MVETAASAAASRSTARVVILAETIVIRGRVADVVVMVLDESGEANESNCDYLRSTKVVC